MRDDLKAAFRSLTSSVTFSVVALLVLALGIGATTAIFSVVDAVVLRGLPFDEHDRLVAVGHRSTPVGAPAPAGRDPLGLSSAAPQNYTDWAVQQHAFESMAAIAGGALTLREPGGEPEVVTAQRVTSDFFKVLRQQPVLGRTFTPEHEVDGRHRVVVLSDGLWRRRFGADPAIVGRSIPLEGAQYDVVGVMGPEFAYPVGAAPATELWVPYVVPADERIRNPRSFSIYLQTIARLKPGISLAQAQANMDQVALALAAEHPEWNKDSFIGVRPLVDHMVGAQTRSWMLMLLGAVGIVLLIACANVANLLLARASTREREIGIRAAMGAGRGRLVRQLMVESLVLAALGTALALVLAWWGVGVLKGAMPSGVPRIASIAIDLRVLGAAAFVALATGLVFGSVPALQLSRPDLTRALKEGARGATSSRTSRYLRNLLVVTEVALAVVLLVGAALFIGSFRTLMKIDPGFNPERTLTASLQPRWDRSVPNAAPPNYATELGQLVDRLGTMPGIVHASFISGGMPMGGSMSQTSLRIAGRDIPRDQSSVSIRRVTPDYHKALEIPLLRGRLFDATDREGAAPVVIINESAAKAYFPDADPVGQTVTVNGDRTIVGVVGDVYQSNLERDPMREAYVPVGQGNVFQGELVIKTSGDPYAVLPAVRSAVFAVLPDVPLRSVRTLEEVLARQVAQRRLNMLLIGLFGLLGLVISAVGIYGVMAYVVAQREREIGVRMALGATRTGVVGMVMKSAVLMIGAGLAMGGAGAWYLARSADQFLFRMNVDDPRAFAAAFVALVVAALLASAIPARRAAGVDPMIALRND